MPNKKPSPEVKDRDWHFLAKLLEWADIEDEKLPKHLSRRARPSWCEVSGEFKLSVKASLQELVELTGLTETQVSGAIDRLEKRWHWLEPFGKTQGKRIREFSLLLPSRDPEAIKVLFEQKWKQLCKGESRSPLSSSKLRKLALERLQREQRWLTISRLTAHQGGERALESADFVAPFLIAAQSEQEDSSFKGIANEKFGAAQRHNSRSTTLLSYETFLNQIFRKRESRKSGGSRIAITGIPGAGKTTLLQNIAFWLAKELEYLPIWISLSQWYQNAASFNNLEAYLLKSWLSLLVPNADRATQKLFEQMCVQGKVCLLVDGADEITIPGVNETVVLNQQLKNSALLSRMTVIMTCRTDHWSNSRNSLQLEFDTYQLIDLVDDRYPDLAQIDQFILRWFRSNSSLGRSLIQELNRKKNLAVKDLMSNRLCLALLCHRWPRWCDQQGLPKSRMKFYERYINDFFSWKPELVTSQALQKQMKQVLGALAYQAFKQEPTPF